MCKNKWFLALSVTCLLIDSTPARGQDRVEQALNIDVP